MRLLKVAVHKWRHPLRAMWRYAKRRHYSISLFSKMGIKGEGGDQKYQKLDDVIYGRSKSQKFLKFSEANRHITKIVRFVLILKHCEFYRKAKKWQQSLVDMWHKRITKECSQSNVTTFHIVETSAKNVLFSFWQTERLIQQSQLKENILIQ